MNPLKLRAEFRIVDLSTDLTRHASGPFETRIEVLEPHAGARFFCEKVLPKIAPHAAGRLGPRDFPDGAFLRHELVTASVHAGSHVDAPGHYGPPEDSSGRHTINDAQLESFIGPGLLVNAVHPPEEPVTADQVQDVLDRNAICDIKSWIVLIRTGGAKAISCECVDFLWDLGVRVIGTDSASFDGPFERMIEAFVTNRDRAVLWPTHMLGRSKPYYQLERLSNLESLPDVGFIVCAPPVRIEGATAAWVRAFALVALGEPEPRCKQQKASNAPVP